ncbi:MAG: hypothetical protein Kow00123_16760 [Anaerolineales bacterium]
MSGDQQSAVSRQRLAVRIGVVVSVALLLLVGAALANGGYEVPWFTVDGGGGESAGGGFTLAGTVGQADAGVLSGGAYTLAGGFWPGAGANFLRFLPIVMK